jgi:hypothetical protein
LYHPYTTSALSPPSLPAPDFLDKDAASCDNGSEPGSTFLQLSRTAKSINTKSSFTGKLCLIGDFIMNVLKWLKDQ